MDAKHLGRKGLVAQLCLAEARGRITSSRQLLPVRDVAVGGDARMIARVHLPLDQYEQNAPALETLALARLCAPLKRVDQR
jgi:hypothetical protein